MNMLLCAAPNTRGCPETRTGSCGTCGGGINGKPPAPRLGGGTAKPSSPLTCVGRGTLTCTGFVLSALSFVVSSCVVSSCVSSFMADAELRVWDASGCVAC